MNAAKKFTSDRYVPTQWSSSLEKAKFANHFVRFVRSDFKSTLFPKWFYTRLSMTFGHIAHFSRDGFYATFFTTTKGKLDFLKHHRGSGRAGKGDPAFTYSDVERDLAGWIESSGLIKEYEGRVQAEIEQTERKQLEYLKAKYESLKA